MEANVYHGSSKKDMKMIFPNKSTHGKSFVYASPDFVVPALFLGRTGGDFSCCIGRNDSFGLYLVERFKGAFDLRYRGKSGSIYTLPGKTFSDRAGLWRDEVVSEVPVVPIGELQIPNATDYIRHLTETGKVDFYEYPSRPYIIPDNDSDLVDRAVCWMKDNPKIIEMVKQFHPNLVERVMRALK